MAHLRVMYHLIGNIIIYILQKTLGRYSKNPPPEWHFEHFKPKIKSHIIGAFPKSAELQKIKEMISLLNQTTLIKKKIFGMISFYQLQIF